MKNSVDYNTKVLEVSHLKQYFKVGIGKHKLKVKAVDDISFDVYKKEVFGLVGESGCGKTTTGRAIIRLYRPTNGIIKLNGNIIGAGVNDYYKDLKYRKQDYKMDLLKLNQYKHDIYLLDKKYDNLKARPLAEIVNLEKEFKAKKAELEKPITDYRESILNERNKYKTSLEKLIFDYNIQKEIIIRQTKNEYLLEYYALLKGNALSLKQKLAGLKESAALTREQKYLHKEEILKQNEIKMASLKSEYEPKIIEKSRGLLSKEDSKSKLLELNNKLAVDKEKLNIQHASFLANLTKPDVDNIRKEVAAEQAKTKLKVAEFKVEAASLEKQLQEEVAHISSSKIIDKEKLDKLNTEYNNFVSEQRIKINEARLLHRAREATQNIRKMQMIFQDPISSLNPRMTVQEIVAEGLVINGEKDKAVIREKVLKALDLVGLSPDYITRYPHEFSGGQRQRIGIARALIMNPSLIIADEPISALDVSIKAQVINLLSELKENLDLSILFIAHDLSVVKFFCDRIAVMYYGKIVELATSEELFKNPLHGYTKALLSAIPHPDPDYEKIRERISYSPLMHDYTVDKPELVEIYDGHFVYANEKEIAVMRKEIGGGK